MNQPVDAFDNLAFVEGLPYGERVQAYTFGGKRHYTASHRAWLWKKYDFDVSRDQAFIRPSGRKRWRCFFQAMFDANPQIGLDLIQDCMATEQEPEEICLRHWWLALTIRDCAAAVPEERADAAQAMIMAYRRVHPVTTDQPVTAYVEHWRPVDQMRLGIMFRDVITDQNPAAGAKERANQELARRLEAARARLQELRRHQEKVKEEPPSEQTTKQAGLPLSHRKPVRAPQDGSEQAPPNAARRGHHEGKSA